MSEMVMAMARNDNDDDNDTVLRTYDGDGEKRFNN